MATTSAALQDNARAALFAAEVEAVRLKRGGLPPTYSGPFAPEPPSRVATLVRPTAGEEGIAYIARRRTAAVLLGNNKASVDARRILTAAEWEAYGRRERADDECSYCNVCHACDEKNPTLAHFSKPMNLTHPGPVIAFDPTNYVTTVSITDFQTAVPIDVAKGLIAYAHPGNWAEVGPQFFKRSEVGTWQDAKWHPEKADGRGSFDLYEVTNWVWNEGSSAEVHNILAISDLTQKENCISYKYALRQCIRSQLGLSWEYGGLDLDNGHYEASYSRNENEALVKISALKQVRYTRPQGNPELGTFLNLVAPALVSMLLRSLVYDSAEQVSLLKERQLVA